SAGPLGAHRSLGCPVHRQPGELGPRPRSRSPTVLTAHLPRRNAEAVPVRLRSPTLTGTEPHSDDPPRIASAGYAPGQRRSGRSVTGFAAGCVGCGAPIFVPTRTRLVRRRAT